MSESGSLAIIGISCLFPKADGLQAFWGNIKNGVDAITPIPAGSHWNVADYFDQDPKASDRTYARRGGFLSPVEFNPMEFGISPKDIEATDTTQLLGMVAAKQALVDAGYGDKPFPRERTSVILGVTGALELVIPLGARLGHPIWRRALKEAGVADGLAEDVVRRIADSYVGWQENSFPGLLGNVAAGRIANRLDLGGTNCVVDAACASSLAALNLACLELTTGRSDLAITGGLDTFNDIFMFMCFSKTPALSPSGDAKPFDRDCDGTIIGEGLGMLVLKRLADAERDGDRIYATIKGIGSSSDGRGNAIYAPRAEGQKEALQRAYAAAAVTPETIELIEAHGTGTKVGDAAELKALTEVYRNARPEGTWTALGSVKSQIGHTKAAAGVAGMIKAALALKHKVLPPTIKVSQPVDEAAPNRSPFYINTQKRPWLPREDHPRRAGVSSFGFGGTNFHCVLEEHGARRTDIGWDGDVEILAFCGETSSDLQARLSELPADPSWKEVRRLAQQSHREFQAGAKYRLLLPVMKGTGLATLREAVLTMLDKHPEKISWALPSGAAFGYGACQGKLGALFPGQGSQYIGMLRDLACQFPGMLDALTEANRIFAREHPECERQRLSDYIYPHPAFSDEARQQQEEALKSTDIAQPAIGAISLGVLNVISAFGIELEAAAGHSYGELPALCGAGRLQTESLHHLSNVRGRLMAKRQGNGDRGAMLAVQATEEAVAQFIREENSPLIVANRNSPSQFVLAGSKSHIEQAAGALAKRSIRARLLPVAAAFHSSLVADARAPFASALEQVQFGRGRIPVYANSTARAYPNGAKQARDILANQMVKPVDFMAQIEAMHQDGVTTFIELGPGHVLSDLVQSILHGREIATVALDSSKSARSGMFDLAAALCRLAALGHKVDLARWETPVESPKSNSNGKVALTVPLCGANYRAPRPQIKPVPAVIQTAAVAKSASAHGFIPAAMPPPAQTPIRPLPPVAATTASPVPGIPKDLTAALQAAQQGILSLQKLQEQTAQLHRQFLEGQDAARRAMESLLAQRRELLGLAPVCPPSTLMPATALAPIQSDAIASPSVGSLLTPAPASISVSLPLAPPAPPANQPAPKSFGNGVVARAVLEVIAEKTGYPVEMLNLSMGLDSDLGIDSIKRVEIMAALRGRLPAAPEIKPEHIGTLQTLQQVVDFLRGGESENDAANGSFLSTQTMVQAGGAGGPPRAGDAFGGQGAARMAATTGAEEEASSRRLLQAQQADSTRISATLLNVVAEKTGYPVEMLNLDMGLDADLGVDSIKRVEIMAAIRTQLPEAPEIKPEHLGTLQTLRQIVDFLAGDREGGNKEASSRRLLQAQQPDSARISATLLNVVAEKTGYPVEMLNLDMGLDADLGVDSIKRVEIMAAIRTQLPEAPEIKPEHLGTLQTLRQMVDFLACEGGGAGSPLHADGASDMRTTARAECRALRSQQCLDRRIVRPMRLSETDDRQMVTLPSNALFWVTDDGSELAAAVADKLRQAGHTVRRGTPTALIADAQGGLPSGLAILWPEKSGGDRFLKEAFCLMQTASAGLRKTDTGKGGVLVTVSRLDGVFGFGALNGKCDPISGGLAGLVKTARHEWPEVNCKAIDLNPESGSALDAAAAIVEEMFRVGPVEVGLSDGHRYGLSMETTHPLHPSGGGVLSEGDVVVIAGGARGVTAAAALQLAQTYRLKLVLLGRSKLQENEPEWLVGVESEADIKRVLLARSNGDRAPRQIEAKYREILVQREIRGHLSEIRAAGATAMYRTVDVRDAAAVQQVFAEIRQELGPIRGLAHGAGVLADRRIEDKTEAQFDLVYGTKVDGLRNLLAASASDDLKVLALFSSYTGRFGRTGQVDYAAANEVLNKIAQVESRRRPGCRVVSFNWGPWNGGMVSDGLRKVFEAEGVGLIDLEAGARFFVREVSSPAGGPVEVLVLAPAPAAPGQGSPEVGEEEPQPPSVAFEREVSIRTLPCLVSHVLNDRPVLPTALMIEWLAHGAIHGNPGMLFHGFENFKVLKGLVLEPHGSAHVNVLAGAGHPCDGLLRVPVQLVSHPGDRQVLHARADILLAETLPSTPAGRFSSPTHRNGKSANSWYADGRLFHGSEFHGVELVETCSKTEMVAWVKNAPAPKQWIQQPLRPVWMADPLVLDSSFQMMIIWSWEFREAASLPCAVRSYRQYAPAFPPGGCRVAIQITSTETPVVTADMRFFDRQGGLLAVAEGYECVVDAALRDAFQRNRLKLEE